MSVHDNLLLAADVGGTKTVLAVVSPDTGTAANLAEATFLNRHYTGLESILEEFLAGFAGRVARASLSVAGLVLDGRAVLSNLPWQIDTSRLRKRYGMAAVHLVNDLQATAYAVPHLSPEVIHTVQTGAPNPRGPRAIIAPGTGLGEAFLLWNGTRFEAFPSEGGNADFAPTDALQIDLLAYLLERECHVSIERVCSGLGIPVLFEFLRASGRAEAPEWLVEQVAAAVDPTPVIVENALHPEAPSDICAQALELFACILAAEAGNLALRLLPTGGVYIGGGIPPRVLPVLKHPSFLESFRRKGRFTDFMERFPVHIILEPRAALLGAAEYGLAEMQVNATRV